MGKVKRSCGLCCNWFTDVRTGAMYIVGKGRKSTQRLYCNTIIQSKKKFIV